MSVSVASVTVAYNAARVLPRQIDVLLRQTRPLQEVIVVDNASTDRTPELLAERYPQVTVLRMFENVGVGGAVAAGLTYAALKRRHDWVWTFDDDSVPHDTSLESLLNGLHAYTGGNERIGLAASLPVHPETGAYYEPLFWRDGFVRPSDGLLRERVFFPDLVITSGCLVRRDVVESIGLPRADFFMDFIDFEYCLRARARGYKIAVVPASTFAHELGNSRQIRLLGFTHVRSEYAPWREYYISRNLIYAAWHLFPSFKTRLFALRRVMRHAVGVALFSPHKFDCLTRMAQGSSDGWRGRLGIRFRPS